MSSDEIRFCGPETNHLHVKAHRPWWKTRCLPGVDYLSELPGVGLHEDSTPAPRWKPSQTAPRVNCVHPLSDVSSSVGVLCTELCVLNTHAVCQPFIGY